MLKDYFMRQRAPLAMAGVLFCLFALMAWLYALPLGAVVYTFALCAAVTMLFFAFGYAGFARRCATVEELLPCTDDAVPRLPEEGDRLEEDYKALVLALCAARTREAEEGRARLLDMEDYYTLWAHQIKTPMAAMHLLLQAPDGPDAAALDAELFKTEQYVEMVLSYLRLGADSNDFVLRRQPLDAILRGCVRKFAKLFIIKKITLHFNPTGLTVLTDDKWMAFIVEQLLSNALKYTPTGGAIYMEEENGRLCIRDTGIGIREEDLPRIKEKGYTGWNGRADKAASGLGLYLCDQAARKLNMTMEISSAPGQGTRVYLALCTELPTYE